MNGTTGWNMEVDLGKKLVFPGIVYTNLRPDIILLLESGKKLIMTELTVTWETRCEEAGLREEEGQVHKASYPMQGKRLSHMVVPH